MNFLQLTQSLRQECGVAGTGPTTTVGQIGQAKKLVDWINTAWLEIQGLHEDWNFMRNEFSFNTVANLGDYTPDGAPGVGANLSDFRHWHTETLRCYIAADGVADEQWLIEWEYQTLRDTYRFGVQTPGRPVVFAVKRKDDALMLGSIPDRVYTITGEYQQVQSELSGDADVPSIPEPLHRIIVYKAMEYYGLFEAAPEVLGRAERGFQTLLTQLERRELPDVSLGDPLA